jgi:site-specific recombinase XerD
MQQNPQMNLGTALQTLGARESGTNGPWVVETERGGPLSVDAMQYIVSAAGEAAGMGDANHPHMLRHGAGYALINDGVTSGSCRNSLVMPASLRRSATPAHVTN